MEQMFAVKSIAEKQMGRERERERERERSPLLRLMDLGKHRKGRPHCYVGSFETLLAHEQL